MIQPFSKAISSTIAMGRPYAHCTVRTNSPASNRGVHRVCVQPRVAAVYWIGNGVLDRFLEDESLFGEFLRTPVSEGGVESLVVEPPHVVVEVGA